METQEHPPIEGLIIRSTRPEDRERVFEFCAATYFIGDYVQGLWDEWIADREGLFLAAELNGRAVGISKLTVQPGGAVWLEGLRVDPQHRGKGIARRLTEALREELDRRRPRAARYLTGSTNMASLRLGELLGMKITQSWWWAFLPMPEEETAELFPAPPELRDYLRDSPYLEMSRGLYSHGWTLYEFEPSVIDRAVAERHAAAVVRDERILGAATFRIASEYDSVQVTLLRHEPDAEAETRAMLFSVAARLGGRRFECFLPDPGWATRLFPEAGLMEAVLLERSWR